MEEQRVKQGKFKSVPWDQMTSWYHLAKPTLAQIPPHSTALRTEPSNRHYSAVLTEMTKSQHYVEQDVPSHERQRCLGEGKRQKIKLEQFNSFGKKANQQSSRLVDKWSSQSIEMDFLHMRQKEQNVEGVQEFCFSIAPIAKNVGGEAACGNSSVKKIKKEEVRSKKQLIDDNSSKRTPCKLTNKIKMKSLMLELFDQIQQMKPENITNEMIIEAKQFFNNLLLHKNNVRSDKKCGINISARKLFTQIKSENQVQNKVINTQTKRQGQKSITKSGNKPIKTKSPIKARIFR